MLDLSNLFLSKIIIFNRQSVWSPKMGRRDFCLVIHLSYPKGGSTSVNANTPKELCTVKYPDISDAIELCIQAGKSYRISRSDMKAAFRNLCLRREDFWLMIMMAKSPVDNKFYYFVDKCLAFGASISCSHFQRFSNCIAHIIRVRMGRKNVNYLDDYLFCHLLKLLCDSQVEEFMAVCRHIGFPVNMEKTFWGTTRLVFLRL